MRTFKVGTIVVGLLFSLALSILISSGCDNSQATGDSTGSSSVDQVILDGEYMRTIKHGNHTYIKFYNNSGIHDPDCEKRDREESE